MEEVKRHGQPSIRCPRSLAASSGRVSRRLVLLLLVIRLNVSHYTTSSVPPVCVDQDVSLNTSLILWRLMSVGLRDELLFASNTNADMSSSLALTTEGTSWCCSLNLQALSWPAVRELLKNKYPAILERFTGLEQVEEAILSDVKLARKAGGFAYEYWCTGGDLRDIDRLLQKFKDMLDNPDQQDESDDEFDSKTKTRVMESIRWNAEAVANSTVSGNGDVWGLTLTQRQGLLEQWKVEIDPRTILDRTAEIHRRHQAAISRRYKAYDEVDARCLEQSRTSKVV